MKLAFWKNQKPTRTGEEMAPAVFAAPAGERMPLVFDEPEIKSLAAPQGSERRSFESAIRDRLTGFQSGITQDIDQDIRHQGGDLRGMARELQKNNDYIKRYLTLLKVHVIGPKGIQMQCRFKKDSGELDTILNEQIESAFSNWGRRPEITRRHSFAEVQRLLISTVARDGEALVRLLYSPEYLHGFSIQLIDVAALDANLNKDLSDGTQIRMGIEMDGWGAPTAYYLKTSWASKNAVVIDGNKYLKIPAPQMIHLFLPEAIGQSRGVTWTHTTIRRLKMLAGYEIAELVSARVASSKMGFFKKMAGVETTFDGDDLEKDDHGNIVRDANPGSFELLPEGYEFQPWNPEHPSGNFAPFVKGSLRGIAAGLGGISYNTLANDLESVNFSSLRQGALEERDWYKMLQEWFIDSFMLPVYQGWLRGAMLSKALKIKIDRYDELSFPGFIPRRWQWVDPYKDTKAAIDAVNAGLKSRSEVAAEQGRSIEDVFAELQREQNLMESMGLNKAPADNKTQNTDQPSEDETP